MIEILFSDFVTVDAIEERILFVSSLLMRSFEMIDQITHSL